MKFSMFNSLIVFFRFFFVKNRLNKLSTISYFFFKMCLTLKSNNLIQTIYFVINVSDKSIFNLFNCVINISAFVFSTKCTSYNQYRIFFSVFSTLRHFRLIASYFVSAENHISFLYRKKWRFSFLYCINTLSQFDKFAFIAKTMFFAFSK